MHVERAESPPPRLFSRESRTPSRCWEGEGARRCEKVGRSAEERARRCDGGERGRRRARGGWRSGGKVGRWDGVKDGTTGRRDVAHLGIGHAVLRAAVGGALQPARAERGSHVGDRRGQIARAQLCRRAHGLGIAVGRPVAERLIEGSDSLGMALTLVEALPTQRVYRRVQPVLLGLFGGHLRGHVGVLCLAAHAPLGGGLVRLGTARRLLLLLDPRLGARGARRLAAWRGRR